MKMIYSVLLSLFFATHAQVTLASDPCVDIDSNISVTGTVDKYKFENAGNGKKLSATVLKLDVPFCVEGEARKVVKIETLQLLPDDYRTLTKFNLGEKITVSGKFGEPGDTAWYPGFYILFYPVTNP